MHRNVPCFRIALQSIEHLQPVHARHVYVERDCIGTNFAGCLEAGFTIKLHHSLVPFVARHIEQDFGEALIVLDHQHGAITFLDVIAVVGDHSLRRRSSLGTILQRVSGRLAPLVATRRTSGGCRRLRRGRGARRCRLVIAARAVPSTRAVVARHRLEISDFGWLPIGAVRSRRVASRQEQSECASLVLGALHPNLAAE